MSEQYSYLSLEDRGEICEVTIARPGDRNSIHSPLMAELNALLEELEQRTTRAVVFRGSGTAYFIGGADGLEMMHAGPEEARAFSTRIQTLFNRMESSPLVLVAAIDGLCFGGGFEFSMACDFRIATDSAHIGLPEVKVGIIPGGGGTQRLARIVGMGVATEMILSGRLYKGAEAKEMGLVHRCTTREELDSEIAAVLKPVLANRGIAVSQAKIALRASQYQGLQEGLKAESEAFSHCFEEEYLKQLMIKQLREGILETTQDISDLVK